MHAEDAAKQSNLLLIYSEHCVFKRQDFLRGPQNMELYGEIAVS